MKVYITRDMDSDSGVHIWNRKPRLHEGGDIWEGMGHLFELPTNRIKSALGRTPRKGSFKQYELSLKEIK